MTAERSDQTKATPDTWMFPPPGGWTYDQVRDLELPTEWELMDGEIVVRGMAQYWHNRVRSKLYLALSQAERTPYTVDTEQCVMIDTHTVIKPDVVVCDKRGLDVFTLERVPIGNVALAVEVVSPGSRSEDRFRKPGLLADAGVPYFWRVERSEDGLPVVHEFWRHPEAGTYVQPDHDLVHRARLKTDVPFPVDISLRELTEL